MLFIGFFQTFLNAYAGSDKVSENKISRKPASSITLKSEKISNIQIFSATLKYIEEHQLPSLEISLYTNNASSTNNLSFNSHDYLPILVANTTTFQMTKTLVEQGLSPLILDMANRSRPGGSVLEGSNAQEETLCRQSNLYTGLKTAYADNYYPIPEHGGILIKSVTFFRDENYDFLTHPIQADVFALAAYDCNYAHKPDLENNLSGYDKPSLEKDYEKGTKAKIRAMLQTAKKNGNDSLVLSAFGCGAFRNDPIKISTFYKEVLGEPEFQNTFKIITFAIKDTGQGNFEVFKNAFKIGTNFSAKI
jgi:uncharacterized protein (TIGR02452 family)